jgi:hypothetical protein
VGRAIRRVKLIWGGENGSAAAARRRVGWQNWTNVTKTGVAGLNGDDERELDNVCARVSRVTKKNRVPAAPRVGAARARR